MNRTRRSEELRSGASFILAVAFASMMLGSITLAIRDQRNELEFIFAIAAVGLAALLGIIGLGVWLRARRLDRETMIVRGNRERFKWPTEADNIIDARMDYKKRLDAARGWPEGRRR